MDAFRGVAILMVLLWHAPAIPVLFGYGMPEWVRDANNALLPFRMPGLMFLSGMLLSRSLAKPAMRYYWGKFQSIAWPYAVWVSIHIALYGSVHPLWHWRAWYATGYLWFLFFILIYYLVAPLVRFVPAWTPPLLAFSVALVLPRSVEERMAYFAIFFFAGYLVSRQPQVLEKLLTRRMVPILVTGCVAAGVISVIFGVESAYRPALAPLSLCGIGVIIIVMRQIADASWMSGVRTIGRNSIVYYVSHFPIITCVLLAFEAIGVHSEVVIAVTGLAVALAVGRLLSLTRHWPAVSWLFEAPHVLARNRL